MGMLTKRVRERRHTRLISLVQACLPPVLGVEMKERQSMTESWGQLALGRQDSVTDYLKEAFPPSFPVPSFAAATVGGLRRRNVSVTAT